MSPIDFRQALEQVYLTNPCQTLPNPLWKTLDKLDEFETSFTTDSAGINRLEAWTADELYIYWRRAGRQPSLELPAAGAHPPGFPRFAHRRRFPALDIALSPDIP